MEQRALARIAAAASRDRSGDQRHLPPAADEPDVSSARRERGLEDRLVERVAARENRDEILVSRNASSERLFGKVRAPDFARTGKALARGERCAIVDYHRGETCLGGKIRDPLAD